MLRVFQGRADRFILLNPRGQNVFFDRGSLRGRFRGRALLAWRVGSGGVGEKIFYGGGPEFSLGEPQARWMNYFVPWTKI